MAIIGREKYNQEKIDKLHDYLRMYEDMGQPIDFEVVVDGFKAVRRTSNPELFSLFENFVNADTRSVEILFYTGSSNNNDKHIFTMRDEPGESGLNGIEVDNRIQEQVSKARKEWEFEQLRKDNQELEEYNSELEKEVEELKKTLQELRGNQSPLHGLLGEFGSSLVSGIIRQNNIAEKIPVLSGLMGTDNTRKESNPESEVTFEAKQEDAEAGEALDFVRYLRAKFSPEEFDQVMKILDLLTEEPAGIEQVLDMLQKQGGHHV